MKTTFKNPFHSLSIMAIVTVMGFALGFHLPNQKEEVSLAQNEECSLGPITVETPVLCWAVDAVDFAVDNELFSILDSGDLRDAVKHYRFYQLVVSELQ